jgi:plasmid stabilization system protein ParE
MANLVWTYRATSDLDEIAEYIAFDNPAAATLLAGQIYSHIEQLIKHPMSGSVPAELPRTSEYRQIIEPPCRIFYKVEQDTVFILHVMRSERLLRPSHLEGKED